jgi:hypothetical protein
MLRLDHNRALSQIAAKTGKPVASIKKLVRLGQPLARRCTPTTASPPSTASRSSQGHDQRPGLEQATPSCPPWASAARPSSRRAACRRRRRPPTPPSTTCATGRWAPTALGHDGHPSNGEYGIPKDVMFGYPGHLRRRRVQDRRRACRSTPSARSASTRPWPNCRASRTASSTCCHPGAAFAQPAVLAGGPAHAGRDPAALRPRRACCPRPTPSRQIMMSHGTFIELLDLAARERGQRAEITLFPEGEFGPEAHRRPAGGAHPAAVVRSERGSEGPALRADPAAATPTATPTTPRASGAGRCRLAGDGRAAAATSRPAASGTPPRPMRSCPATARSPPGLAHRDGHAARHAGVVQGAARGRRRDRPPPGRLVADRPPGGGDDAAGPVRPQPGAGARLDGHAPADRRVSPRRSHRRPPSCG